MTEGNKVIRIRDQFGIGTKKVVCDVVEAAYNYITAMATVYISSTYSDLKECREHVYHALRQLGHDVRAMEDYVASDTRPLKRCLDDVGRCDIYVGIFAWRYGFVPEEDNPEQQSITELEFRHACDRRIPTLVFLLKAEAPWPRSAMDVGDESRKIESLRGELSKSKTVSFFDDAENLAVLVNAAVTNKLTDLRERQTAVDWLDRHLERTERLFTSHMSGVDRLTQNEAAARYVELLIEKRAAKPDERPDPPRPFAEYVRSGARLVVLGEGGSGKTTSLLRLAFEAVRKVRVEPSQPIPIYVKLNFFDAKEKSVDALMQTVAISNGLNVEDLRALWSDESRAILFLLDGFNEVRSEFQESCALALEAIMQRRQHTCVITSRPTSQVRLLIERSKADELSVVKLDDQRLEEFLQRHNVASLYEQLGTELKELGRNPFLLWALAQSYVGLANTELPRNKGQLYRNLFDRYLFGIHEQRKRPSPTEYNYELVKKPVLAALAMTMTTDGVTRATRDIQLLRGIFKQLSELRLEYEGPVGSGAYTLMPERPSANGILDEAALNGVLYIVGDTIEFMHQSVQDYFTAVRMLDWQIPQILELAPPQSFRSVPERGNSFDAMVMLAGLMQDGTELLKALAGVNPLLAAHCLPASHLVSRTVRAELLDRWARMLHQPNRDYQRLACECLGVARCERVDLQREIIDLAVFGDYLIQTAAREATLTIRPQISLEYLVALGLSERCRDESLGEVRELLFKLHPDAAVAELFERWRRAEPGTESRRRLEVLLTHETRTRNQLVAIRVDAIRRQDRESSLAAKEALERLAEWQNTYPPGLQSTASKLARQIKDMRHLAQGVPTMSPVELIANLQVENYVAGRVAAEIGKRRLTEGLQPLIDVLLRQHIDPNIEPMVKAIEQIDRTEGMRLLRARLQDGPDGVRAAVALGLLGEVDVVPLVERAFQNENQAFRRAAAIVLANTGTDSAVETLRAASLVEDNRDFLGELVRALGRVKSKAAVSVLLDLLLRGPFNRLFAGGEDSPRKAARAAILDAVGPQEFANFLREAARDGRSATRRVAILEMMALEPPPSELPDVLREAWRDPERGVRATALRGLIKLEPPPSELPDVLREAWRDPEGGVRATALRGLIKTGAPTQLRSLLDAALKDKDAEVRAAAVDAWHDADANESAAIWLTLAISDPDSQLRRHAAAKLLDALEPALDGLSRVLENGSVEARLAAVEALTALRSEDLTENRGGLSDDNARDKVLASLRRALSDTDTRVRLTAIEALGKFRSDRAIIATFVNIAWHDVSVSVRQAAASWLSFADGGREALLQPIWDRWDQGVEPKGIIKVIGEEQLLLPDDGYFYALRGFLFSRVPELNKAQADYDEALKHQYDSGWLRTMQAELCAARGQYVEACEMTRKALQFKLDDAEAHAYLGWYLYKTGNLQESIEESGIAFELQPDLVMAALNLGLAYLAAGDFGEARHAYAGALEACAATTTENKIETVKGALADIDELVNSRPEVAPIADELKGPLSAVLNSRS